MEALLGAACNGEKGERQPSYMYIAGIPGGQALREQLDGLEYFSATVELGVFQVWSITDETRLVVPKRSCHLVR